MSAEVRRNIIWLAEALLYTPHAVKCVSKAAAAARARASCEKRLASRLPRGRYARGDGHIQGKRNKQNACMDRAIAGGPPSYLVDTTAKTMEYGGVDERRLKTDHVLGL